MNQIAVCHTKAGKHGEQIARAICDGIAACGDSALWVSSLVDVPLIDRCRAVVMTCDAHPDRDGDAKSFRNAVVLKARSAGLARLVIETGFIRNAHGEHRGEHHPRETRWAAGWNGIKRGASYSVPEGAGAGRWTALRVPRVPETVAGDPRGNVLVFGQVDGGYAEIGLSMLDEYRRVLAVCREKLPGVSVFFRPHPQLRREPHRLIHRQQVQQMGYLLDWHADPYSIRNARVAVTWSSNVSVDVVLAGVPLLCLSDLNIAYDVSEHVLERIGTPWFPPGWQRQEFVEKLAWCQWTIDEFANGSAWRQLRTKLEG